MSSFRPKFHVGSHVKDFLDVNVMSVVKSYIHRHHRLDIQAAMAFQTRTVFSDSPGMVFE